LLNQEHKSERADADGADGQIPTSLGPGEKVHGLDRGTITGVPFMITRAIRADLRAAGYTEDAIKGMTPTQALARLGHTTPCPGCKVAMPLDQLCYTSAGPRCRTCGGVTPKPEPEPETVEDPTPAEAHAPPTAAQAAQLSKLGVHREVLAELSSWDAERLLGDPPIIPMNACKAPKDDLRELAKVLGRVSTSSAKLADMAVQYGGGVAVTAAMIDAIKAGGWAPYAVRDAIWVALS
jgi:hypothetical protein